MSEWIRLHDSEWTPEKISDEIAKRSLSREVEFGPLEIHVPPFKSQGGTTRHDRSSIADLIHHLRTLNEMPNFEITPILEDSPTTRIPWITSAWGLVRGKFHNLVLFYINRASRQQSQVNKELIASLNELMHVIDARQEQPQSITSELPEP